MIQIHLLLEEQQVQATEKSNDQARAFPINYDWEQRSLFF